MCVCLQIARLALAIKLRLEYSACVGELQQARMQHRTEAHQNLQMQIYIGVVA